MPVASIKIYGRNDNPTSSAVDAVSTIETGVENTDWWVWEFDANFINPQPEDETEEKEYLNYVKDSVPAYRIKYEIEAAPVDFPSASSSITFLFPELNVLNKDYLWLWLNDYKILCYTNHVNNAIRVYKDKSYTIETDSGRKIKKVTLLERKRNRDHT